MRWVFLAASLVGCAAGNTRDVESSANFSVSAGSWELDNEEYSFRATYTTTLNGEREAASGVWIVAVQVVRDAYLDPSKPADSAVAFIDVVDGRGTITITDYAGRCSSYLRSNCIREAQAPKVSVRVRAWSKLYEAPAR